MRLGLSITEVLNTNIIDIWKKQILTAKPLTDQILDFLKKQQADPQELCTATAQALTIITGAIIEVYDRNPVVIIAALGMCDKMKQAFIDEFGDGEA